MVFYNPYSKIFEKSVSFYKCAEIALWVSTILLGAIFVLDKYNIILKDDVILLSSFNCFFVIIYAIISFISDFIFYQASIQRREDFIDNSFKTTLAEHRSDGYYSNDNINAGIYKMAINGFENSLFTYKIASKMTLKLWIKNVLFVILFLLFAVYDCNKAFILVIQLTLPILLLQQAVKHTLFVYRIQRVFDNYRRLFNALRNESVSKQRIPEIIHIVLDYETTLTYGAIMLDSKIYDKLNPELSNEWNLMKSSYNIQ